MIKRIAAAWRVFRADKWVVLTWCETTNPSVTQPYFRWSMSNYSNRFLKRVQDHVYSLRQQRVRGDGRMYGNGNGFWHPTDKINNN